VGDVYVADPGVRDIQTKLSQYTPNCTVVWVPSHLELIQGNEIANDAAEDGARLAEEQGENSAIPALPNNCSVHECMTYVQKLLRRDFSELFQEEMLEIEHRSLAWNPTCRAFPIRNMRSNIPINTVFLYKAFIGCTHNLHLYTRNIIESPVCTLCNRGNQDLIHVFTKCSVMKIYVQTLLEEVYELDYDKNPHHIFFPPKQNIEPYAFQYYYTLYLLSKYSQNHMYDSMPEIAALIQQSINNDPNRHMHNVLHLQSFNQNSDVEEENGMEEFIGNESPSW
jgi:hypothetical protein